jgi:hypothetical protein
MQAQSRVLSPEGGLDSEEQVPFEFPDGLADYLLSRDDPESLEQLCLFALEQGSAATLEERDAKVLLWRAYAIGEQGAIVRACNKLERLRISRGNEVGVAATYLLLKFRELLRAEGDTSEECGEAATALLGEGLKLSFQTSTQAGLLLAGRVFMHRGRFKKAIKCFKGVSGFAETRMRVYSAYALLSWTVIVEILNEFMGNHPHYSSSSTRFGPPKLNKKDSKLVTREIKALQAMSDVGKESRGCPDVWFALLVAYDLVCAPEKALEALLVVMPLCQGIPQADILEDIKLDLLRSASSKLADPTAMRRVSSCQLDDEDSHALFVSMDMFGLDKRSSVERKHHVDVGDTTVGGQASTRARNSIRLANGNTRTHTHADEDPPYSDIYHPPAARAARGSQIVPNGLSDSKTSSDVPSRKSNTERGHSSAIKAHAAKKEKEAHAKLEQNRGLGRSMHYKEANERAQQSRREFCWAALPSDEQLHVRSKALEFLARAASGGSFMKHGRHGSPHERVVRIVFDTVGEDFLCDALTINWTSNKLRIDKSSLPYVLQGKQTAVLLRSVSESAEDECCFSICSGSGGRTVDLEAPDARTCKEWTKGLHRALQFCFRSLSDEGFDAYREEAKGKPSSSSSSSYSQKCKQTIKVN